MSESTPVEYQCWNCREWEPTDGDEALFCGCCGAEIIPAESDSRTAAVIEREVGR